VVLQTTSYAGSNPASPIWNCGVDSIGYNNQLSAVTPVELVIGWTATHVGAKTPEAH
jgi:hypothetical protein